MPGDISIDFHRLLNASRQPGDSIESVDLEGQLTLVGAARNAGISRFIYVSFREDCTVQYPLTQAKRALERAIADLDFTSIQASYFMEVWLSPALGFDYMHSRARIYGDGTKPISWVSYRDVAEFCIAPVLRSVGSRSVLVVGGPEALSPLDVVRIFEEESGGRFEVESIPEEKLREQLDSANDSLEKSFAGIMLQYAHGDAIDMARSLELNPIRLTSVREYARAVSSHIKACQPRGRQSLRKRRETLCRPLFWYTELGKEPLRGISSFQSFRVPGKSHYACTDGSWRGFKPALSCRKFRQPY